MFPGALAQNGVFRCFSILSCPIYKIIKIGMLFIFGLCVAGYLLIGFILVPLVTNYSAYITSHPGVNYEKEDYTPDGNPFSMVIVDNNFYVVEANTGVLDKITIGGVVSGVADISATQCHIVPNAVAFHNGNFYVGNLNVFLLQVFQKFLRFQRQVVM